MVFYKMVLEKKGGTINVRQQKRYHFFMSNGDYDVLSHVGGRGFYLMVR